MHESTKRELIEQGTGVVGSLLKEMLVHKNQVEVMREQKEKEIEVARARAKAQENAGNGGVSGHDHHPEPSQQNHDDQTQGVTQATPAEIEAALDELIDEEMCSVCQQLLVALKDKPTEEQIHGIMEYGTFKKELGDGANVEELKALLRETDVLQSIFQEKFNGAGNN